MAAAPRLIPRKTPSQQRSRQTYEVILEAAARVLETAGPAGFNTNAVAARAGVSVGSLYQYFPSKDALVAELSRRGAQALLAALAEVVAEAPSASLQDDVRRLARAAIAWQSARPALERALDQLEEGLDLDTDARGTTRAIGDVIVRLLAPHLSGASTAQLREVAGDSLALARALIDRAVERGDVNSPGFESRLVGAICGYLDAVAEV